MLVGELTNEMGWMYPRVSKCWGRFGVTMYINSPGYDSEWITNGSVSLMHSFWPIVVDMQMMIG